MTVLTSRLRADIRRAADAEWTRGEEGALLDRLDLALANTPDGLLPDVDLSEVEDELELDDASFIVLTLDFFGLDR